MQENDLADDLLEGAAEIGAFLGWNQRRVFYEAARRGDIPVIRIGRLLRVPVVAMERLLERAGERTE